MRENYSVKFDIGYLIGKIIVLGRVTVPTALIFCAWAAIVLAIPITAHAACPTPVSSPLNVMSCGALGDNSVDDGPAVQDAVNALSTAGGGTVYFPPGLYRVDSTIYVPSDIRLQSLGSTVYNTQIRLTATQTTLFEVISGSSNIVFKDLTLFAVGPNPNIWPRNAPGETLKIRGENTTGISLRAINHRSGGISDVRIENVRINQFTYGIAAPEPGPGIDVSVIGIKIRNYASDGNEYALYTSTKGADDWDVQNMDVYQMYDRQNGIFLKRSGQMRFLQLSCAGHRIAPRYAPDPDPFPGQYPGICATLWDNGDTYFRQMHVEGPRLSICAGSDCDPTNPSYAGANSSTVTIENSAADGEFHRATDLVSINNRFWIDLPPPQPPAHPSYKFLGAGVNSSLKSCGNVWVSWNSVTHRTNTTVTPPSTAFPGLATALQGCERAYLTAVPVFDTGYEPDNERLTGEVNVTDPALCAPNPANCATNGGTNDDTIGFQLAINAARATRGKRVFVPAGTYDISSTLDLAEGETIIGEAGSVINLETAGVSLFRVLSSTGYPVNGITFRNLTLTSATDSGTIGINFENVSTSTAGAASDFQIQNVDFYNFENGIAVRPVGGNLANASPMFDSVSVKDCDFTGNKIAVLLRSENASNWNLENLRVTIPGTGEAVRIDGAGHVGVRNLACTGSGSGATCLTVQRQLDTSIEGVTATGVQNALVVPWDNGWTQFPVTLRNNDLRAGVYFQGRIYLNSVNNLYPAKLKVNSTAQEVIFGAYLEGSPNNNVSYGGLSDIFSCDDTFRDPGVTLPQSTWAYVGTLSKPITYCY